MENKTKAAVIFVLVALSVAIVISLDLWGAWVEPVTGTATLVVAVVAWWEARHSERDKTRPVEVFLKSPDEEKKLPLYLTKGSVSRAEVLGRLGMIPMAESGKRFSLKGISQPAFLKQLNLISQGKANRIVIDSSTEELNQFDWQKLG